MIRRLLPRSERDLVLRGEVAPRDLDPQPPRRPRTPPGPPSPAPNQATSARASLLRDLSTAAGVRRAVLLSEILGRPVALREPRDGLGGS